MIFGVATESSLNAEQKLAVESVYGPVLVLAGAGTGKTKTIVHRISHIIMKGYASADQILAVTFTNKAASEMLNRVRKLAETPGIWLGTFHNIAARILRQNASLVGLNSDFTIVNTDDQMQIIKGLVKENCPEYSGDSGYKLILHKIQRWKDKGLLPHEVSDTEITKAIDYSARTVYYAYQEKLTFLNSADFGDLLLYNVVIFQNHQDVLSRYQNKFQYVMVDEYQDTNIVQYLWLRLLTQKHKNLCCVGDDDQSIYGWRGAEVGNILKFSDDFPNSKIIRLECNYRSTANIIAVASAIIDNNIKRLDKKLWTVNGDGHRVNLLEFYDDKTEARAIMELIRDFHDYQFNEIAILVRSGFQTRVFEESFLSCRIPYKIVGGTKFYDRQEIRDLIAYLRVVTNGNDGVAFERMLTRPKRGIGEATFRKIYACAFETGLPILNSAQEMVNSNQITGKAGSSLKKLLDHISSWQDSMNDLSLSELVERIYYESGYREMLDHNNEDSSSRIDNINELFSALSGFKDAHTFLDHISLVSDADQLSEDDNAVCVMTLHAAKGLEFPVVFLPGWEEETFPTKKAIEDTTGRSLEEERRLAYVGITRAKEQLFISYCKNRFNYQRQWNQYTQSSRFIRELPSEGLQFLKYNGTTINKFGRKV